MRYTPAGAERAPLSRHLPRCNGCSVKQSLRHFAVFIVWNLAISTVLLVSVRPQRSGVHAGLGMVLIFAFAIAVIYLYVLRAGSPQEQERAVDLRLTPLRGDPLRWTLLAAPVLLLFSWSLGEVYMRLVPVPSQALNPFGQLFVDARGRLMLALLAVGIAPLIEEFFFRGLIQRALERRWGIAGGIAGASALFALVHFIPWIFPLHLVLGAAFGFAVVAARSIWAGVLLHAANNSVALLGLGLERGEIPVVSTIWVAGPDVRLWVSIAALAAATWAGVWIGRRLWKAGRDSGLRHEAGVG
jgi:uncharacterized protein